MLKVANLTHTPTQTHQLLNNGNSANTSKHKARSKLGLLPIDKIYMTNIKDLHYYVLLHVLFVVVQEVATLLTPGVTSYQYVKHDKCSQNNS